MSDITVLAHAVVQLASIVVTGWVIVTVIKAFFS